MNNRSIEMIGACRPKPPPFVIKTDLNSVKKLALEAELAKCQAESRRLASVVEASKYNCCQPAGVGQSGQLLAYGAAAIAATYIAGRVAGYLDS